MEVPLHDPTDQKDLLKVNTHLVDRNATIGVQMVDGALMEKVVSTSIWIHAHFLQLAMANLDLNAHTCTRVMHRIDGPHHVILVSLARLVR